MAKEKISVVICTYNRVKFLPGSLNALVNQNLSKDQFEILVVNNNCNDNTSTVVNDFIKTHSDFDIRMVMEHNQGLSYARNRGIEEAKYDVITYIDDDGNAEENYLKDIQIAFDIHPEWVGIGGKVIPIYESEEPAWYNPFLRMMVTRIDFGDKIFKCYGKKYPAGCSMSYRKQILSDAGGFNNELKWRADDKYIFQVVSAINDQIFYLPHLKVHHHIDDARITDQNFDRLSGLLGSEERLRILGKKKWAYPFKVGEFVFKYVASLLIAIFYLAQGQWIKGKYVIRFRKLALLRFLGL